MKREMHLGDPCVFCDQPWDAVASGDCPGRPGLEESADALLTVDALQDRYLRLHEEMTQAVTAEREACAEIADNEAAFYASEDDDRRAMYNEPDWGARSKGSEAKTIAAAIRARGDDSIDP